MFAQQYKIFVIVKVQQKIANKKLLDYIYKRIDIRFFITIQTKIL